MKQTKKNKTKKLKLRINPKNAQTRSGTLATPEAFDPAVQSVAIFRRLIGEKAARKTVAILRRLIGEKAARKTNDSL